MEQKCTVCERGASYCRRLNLHFTNQEKTSISLLNIFISSFFFITDRKSHACFKYMYSVTQTSIAPLRLVEKGIFTVSVKLFCIKMKQPNQRVDATQDLVSPSRLDDVPVAPERQETRLGKILRRLGLHALHIQTTWWQFSFFLIVHFLSCWAASKSSIWHWERNKETQKNQSPPPALPRQTFDILAWSMTKQFITHFEKRRRRRIVNFPHFKPAVTLIHMKTVVPLLQEKDHMIDGGKKFFLQNHRGASSYCWARRYWFVKSSSCFSRSVALCLQKKHTQRASKLNKVQVDPSQPRTQTHWQTN